MVQHGMVHSMQSRCQRTLCSTLWGTSGTLFSTPGTPRNTPGTLRNTPGTLCNTPGTLCSNPGTLCKYPGLAGTQELLVIVHDTPHRCALVAQMNEALTTW